FIDTASGQVATQHQLIAAGLAPPDAPPPRPWLRIQGSGDASTMWYAVLRRQGRGIFIGTLGLRPRDHHAPPLDRGSEDVPIEAISASCEPSTPAPSPRAR